MITHLLLGFLHDGRGVENKNGTAVIFLGVLRKRLVLFAVCYEPNEAFPEYPEEDDGGSVFIFDPPPVVDEPEEEVSNYD